MMKKWLFPKKLSAIFMDSVTGPVNLVREFYRVGKGQGYPVHGLLMAANSQILPVVAAAVVIMTSPPTLSTVGLTALAYLAGNYATAMMVCGVNAAKANRIWPRICACNNKPPPPSA